MNVAPKHGFADASNEFPTARAPTARISRRIESAAPRKRQKKKTKPISAGQLAMIGFDGETPIFLPVWRGYHVSWQQSVRCEARRAVFSRTDYDLQHM
jgi:hypothetical protein